MANEYVGDVMYSVYHLVPNSFTIPVVSFSVLVPGVVTSSEVRTSVLVLVFFTNPVVTTFVLIPGLSNSPVVRAFVLVPEGCTSHVFSTSFSHKWFYYFGSQNLSVIQHVIASVRQRLSCSSQVW